MPFCAGECCFFLRRPKYFHGPKHYPSYIQALPCPRSLVVPTGLFTVLGPDPARGSGSSHWAQQAQVGKTRSRPPGLVFLSLRLSESLVSACQGCAVALVKKSTRLIMESVLMVAEISLNLYSIVLFHLIKLARLPALSHVWQHVKLSDALSWGPSAI